MESLLADITLLRGLFFEALRQSSAFKVTTPPISVSTPSRALCSRDCLWRSGEGPALQLSTARMWRCDDVLCSISRRVQKSGEGVFQTNKYNTSQLDLEKCAELRDLAGREHDL